MYTHQRAYIAACGVIAQGCQRCAKKQRMCRTQSAVNASHHARDENVPDRSVTPITAAVPGRPMQGETEACSGVVVLQ
jgi:hypothetical protein